ncbi:C-4 sterol methyl oxidase [Sorochytrium milnesiophthora]
MYVTVSLVSPWLNEVWQDLFRGRNESLTLAILSFTVHEIAYYGRYVPFWIASKIRALDKYRIQPDKHISDAQWWKCIRGVLVSHFVVELPVMLGFHPIAEFFGMRVTEGQLPSWTAIALQVFLFMVVEDFIFYWTHRILHEVPSLYRRFHKMHHEFAAPFGLAAEYAHPLETVVQSAGTIVGPLAYAAIVGDFHVFTLLVWIFVRILQAVEAHSGYDFPWSMNNIIPFWCGADHHDYHHQAFRGNYASSFRWWDYVLNTEGKYRSMRANQRAAKQAKLAAASAAIKDVQKPLVPTIDSASVDQALAAVDAPAVAAAAVEAVDLETKKTQ